VAVDSPDSDFITLAHFIRLEDAGLPDIVDALHRCRSDLDKIALLKRSLKQKDLAQQLDEEAVFLVAAAYEIVEDLAKVKQLSSKVPAEVFELLQTSKAYRKKIAKLFGLFFDKQLSLKDLV
jgi:trans-2-enoyl-CoA reductase